MDAQEPGPGDASPGRRDPAGDADEPAPLPRRTGTALAAAGFVALLTSLLMPWWDVRNDLGEASTAESVRLWGAGMGLAHPEAVLATTILAALPLPWLFVRLAGRSWVHEPRAWRRDLGLCALLALAALASAWLWPQEGAFWGVRAYPVDGGGELRVVQSPSAGWWTALIAAAMLAWGWRRSDPAG